MSKPKLLRLAAIIILLALVVSVLAATGVFRAAAYDSLTYLYGGTTSTYLKRMSVTGDGVDIVSPDYFETSDSGAVIFTKKPDPLLISDMHGKKIKVTPFMSNHWNRAQARAMLKAPAAAAAFLAAAVRDYDLDGLDIDIQNINQDDRADLTSFIALLRNALPSGKTLTVCVAPNPYNTNAGWQGGYDYAALAKHCDHVFMMTYDESYETGAPGPVASLKFVEDSVKYGLKYVAPEKLMLGIPFYGRYWAQSAGGKKGGAWTIADIDWLAETTNAKVWYDEAKECARATIVVPAGSNLKTWGGSSIPPDTYDVWYENARSFERKLALVRKYGLKGAGSWALGQEPAYVWDNYSAWLNGLPFSDVKDHWAQSYIVSLAAEGLLSGHGDGTFGPEGSLTRAEAATLLCRISGLEPASAPSAFADTAGHWANGYIAAAKSASLIDGYGGGVFKPDRAVSREEFAVMSERLLALEDTVNLTDPPFSDVSKSGNPWSNDAILILAAQGVLSGYGDGSFQPKRGVTRGESAKIICLLRALPLRVNNGKVQPPDGSLDHMEPR
ncbi:MAG: S-layer homology domain-containing protein [Oscillospiraceae bacterium]|jgi:spore germination protein YaaH|nr:S-layer homology domain-containing protein [Oscillospiraceae bacterium]